MFFHNATADVVRLDKISEERAEGKGADGSELIFEDPALSWDRKSQGGSSCHRGAMQQFLPTPGRKGGGGLTFLKAAENGNGI